MREYPFLVFLDGAPWVHVGTGVVLFPIAGLLMHPRLAGVAVSLRSVSVIANALRLRGARLDCVWHHGNGGWV